MSSEYNSLFSAGIKEHVGLQRKEIERVSDRIFHTSDTKSRYVDMMNWELYPRPSRRRPGEGFAAGAFAESFGKRFVMVNFGLMDAIPIEDWEDDPYRVMRTLLPMKGGALADSFSTNEELVCAEFFSNYGYVSGTSVTGSFDGVCLFSTAHPISKTLSATTASNRPSSEVDVSIAGIDGARTNLVTQLAENNVTRLSNKPKFLVINPSQYRVASQCVRGDWERATADRNMNIVKEYGIQIIEWGYFTKSGATGTNNAWFILGQRHHLHKITREECKIASDTDISTNSFIWTARARFDVGAVNYRGTYGSVGV